ncbi:MAG: patatin-like phospholipase family protein [Neisseria sp.]|nr:patatin-like phospholipase family protein [Neisseria sp.]
MKSFLNQRFMAFCGALLCGLLTACSSPTPPPVVVQKPVRVALALGGGASKGFAHIGVIKVLQENNIPVHIVTGTSAGAVVGSLYASGMSVDRLELESELLDKADVADLTLSGKGFIIGQKLQDYINRKVKNVEIQEFPLRFAAVATDFENGKAVAFNYGNTGQAVRASASIPNVFQPVEINGRRYVDGGLSAPVPVTAARNLGATVVIAVDISARPEKNIDSGFLSFFQQSLNIMSMTALESELAKADVVIRPKVQALGAVGGFDRRAQAIAAGEAATREALPHIRAAVAAAAK